MITSKAGILLKDNTDNPAIKDSIGALRSIPSVLWTAQRGPAAFRLPASIRHRQVFHNDASSVKPMQFPVIGPMRLPSAVPSLSAVQALPDQARAF